MGTNPITETTDPPTITTTKNNAAMRRDVLLIWLAIGFLAGAMAFTVGILLAVMY
jgi:hypothetical protein